MPRTRFDKKKHEALAVLITGHVYKDGGSLKEGARLIGCDPSTLCRRLANPGKFSIDELLALARGYHIPIEDLRAAIRF